MGDVLPQTIGELRRRAAAGELPVTVSVEEALPWLGISRPVAFRACAATPPGLPCIRIGGRVRILVGPLLDDLGVTIGSGEL